MAILFILLKSMLLASGTNVESVRVSVVRGIMCGFWWSPIPHLMSFSSMQISVMASTVLVSASGGTPTDHPQSVH